MITRAENDVWHYVAALVRLAMFQPQPSLAVPVLPLRVMIAIQSQETSGLCFAGKCKARLFPK
jgi:hypothetical protein